MCDDPQTPSGGDSDHAGCSDDTEQCEHCEYWSQDHSVDVDEQSTKYVTTTQRGAWGAKFRLEARLAGGEIRVTHILRWGTVDNSLTDAQKNAIKTALRTDVPAAWSNQHEMRIMDPICGEVTLPIRFRVLWTPGDTTDSHQYLVHLARGPRTSSAGNGRFNLDHEDSSGDKWTLKHEFGHTIGAPDEYFYSGITAATNNYKRADGTTEAITLEPAANIMRSRGNTTVKKRFLYMMEIEAQELLRDRSGRNIVCEIL